MDDQMNEYIRALRDGALKLFPGAIGVEIFISYYDVSVTPRYSCERDGTTMKTIDGGWCTEYA